MDEASYVRLHIGREPHPVHFETAAAGTSPPGQPVQDGVRAGEGGGPADEPGSVPSPVGSPRWLLKVDGTMVNIGGAGTGGVQPAFLVLAGTSTLIGTPSTCAI